MLVKTSRFSIKKMLVILIKNLQHANVGHHIGNNVQPQYQQQVSIIRLVSAVGHMLEKFLHIFLISSVGELCEQSFDTFLISYVDW